MSSVDEILKDMFPAEGSRLKQWVVDRRKFNAWESETCPKLYIEEHDDNTGARCRNVGVTAWCHLDHDCCHTCNVVRAATCMLAPVATWMQESTIRASKLEQDHSVLSDETEPRRSLEPNVMLRFVKRDA